MHDKVPELMYTYAMHTYLGIYIHTCIHNFCLVLKVGVCYIGKVDRSMSPKDFIKEGLALLSMEFMVMPGPP